MPGRMHRLVLCLPDLPTNAEMKTTHELLAEIVARPDAKDVMANIICNMLDEVAFGGVLDEDDFKTFLENSAP